MRLLRIETRYEASINLDDIKGIADGKYDHLWDLDDKELEWKLLQEKTMVTSLEMFAMTVEGGLRRIQIQVTEEPDPEPEDEEEPDDDREAQESRAPEGAVDPGEPYESEQEARNALYSDAPEPPHSSELTFVDPPEEPEGNPT